MTPYKNWKLRYKLFTPILMVILISAVAGVFSNYVVFNALSQDTLPELESISELKAGTLDLIGEYREYFVKSTEVVELEIQETIEHLDIQLQTYSTTALKDEQEAHFVPLLKSGLEELESSGEKVIGYWKTMLDELEEWEEEGEAEYRKNKRYIARNPDLLHMVFF